RMSAGSTALAGIAAGWLFAGGQTTSAVAAATGEGSSDSEATALACESSCGSALASTSSTVARDVLVVSGGTGASPVAIMGSPGRRVRGASGQGLLSGVATSPPRVWPAPARLRGNPSKPPSNALANQWTLRVRASVEGGTSFSRIASPQTLGFPGKNRGIQERTPPAFLQRVSPGPFGGVGKTAYLRSAQGPVWAVEESARPLLPRGSPSQLPKQVVTVPARRNVKSARAPWRGARDRADGSRGSVGPRHGEPQLPRGALRPRLPLSCRR